MANRHSRRAKLKYEPLISANNDIRILIIEPSRRYSDEIQSQLVHAPLETRSGYVALSYCWGRPDLEIPIKVDGKTVHITVNLASALMRLRSGRIKRVWVDAICVNQSDLEERSHQITRMAAIYRCATAVITWLGPCPDDTIQQLVDLKHNLERLLRFSSRKDKFQRLGGGRDWRKEVLDSAYKFPDTSKAGRRLRVRALRRVARGVRRFQDGKSLDRSVSCTNTKSALKHIHENLQGRHWAPFIELLSCEYWSRAWIIQEISMAKHLIIFWGKSTIDFADISFFVLAYQDMWKAGLVGDIAAPTTCQHIRNLNKFKKLQMELKPISLVRALEMASYSKSTDPRDKVYAIMGLTYNGPIIFPTPSYGRSLWKVNADATLRIIETERSLDYILAKSRKKKSWVISWFNAATWQDKRLVRYLEHKESVATTNLGSFLLPEIARIPPKVCRRNRHLLVKGTVVDSIRRCSATYRERKLNTRQPFFKPGKQRKTVSHRERRTFECFCVADEDHLRPNLDAFYSGIKAALVGGTYRKDPRRRAIRDWIYCPMNASFSIGHRNLEQILGLDNAPRVHDAIGRKAEWAENALSRVDGALGMGMRLGETCDGKLGWFPKSAKPGDEIAVLSGCSVPVVLRSSAEGAYTVIGKGLISKTNCYDINTPDQWPNIKLT